MNTRNGQVRPVNRGRGHMRVAVRRLASVGAAAATLIVVGCSGSSSAPTASPDPTPALPSPTTAPTTPAGSNVPGAKGFPTAPTPTAHPSFPTASTPAEVRDLLRAAFDSAQGMWRELFTHVHKNYDPAKLHFYTSEVESACGVSSAEVGPFYCPADHGVYLDVSFFVALHRRLGTQSNFGEAYVVAHEVGHHIQNLLGTLLAVHRLQQENPHVSNALSVRQELQADCYAGVWAHATYQQSLLSEEDLRAALAAAASVGDDFLQHAATGTVHPENWTHGSSAQRQHWLSTGFHEGTPAACDTFAGGP